jgi:hypothetical protein
MTGRAALCLLLSGILGTVELRAADMSGRIAAGLIETDNIQRTPTDLSSDTIEEVAADFTLHKQTRRVEADVISSLQYLSYVHHIYSSDVVGNLAAIGKFAFVPGHIEWVAQDNFGQQQLDPGVPVTPLNLEDINYFSTGPNLIFGLGSALDVQLSGRYSRMSYQTSDLDNNRSDISAALVHALSTNSNISLRANDERVRYLDSVANPDYTTQQGFLRYDTQIARSKLALDLGYDDVTGLSSKGSGALIHGDFSRTITASSRIDLSIGQDISDTGNLLRQLQDLNGVVVSTASLQRSNDPFVNRYARLAWQFDKNRTSVSFDLARFQERHLDNFSLNETRTEADATLRRKLSPALTAIVTASYARAIFEDTEAGYREQIESAVLEWRIERRLELRAEYDHFKQRGDGATNRFIENRLGLTVGMRFGSAL